MLPRHTKLKIDRTHAPMVRKLMSDNSGAAIVLIDLLSRGRGIGTPVSDDVARCLTTLDSFGIYGDDLYVLWADVCSRNTELMLTVLKASSAACNGMNRETLTLAIACRDRVPVPAESSLVS